MKAKTFFCFLFISILLITILGCSSRPRYDSFAKCLTEKGARMYGTEWCSHCQTQKGMFGKSFQYVNYTDCDRDRDECLRAGVKRYPTWIIDGEIHLGEKQLERLAFLSGCDLVEDCSDKTAASCSIKI